MQRFVKTEKTQVAKKYVCDCILLFSIISKIVNEYDQKKYHNHKPQTTTWHNEEEPHKKNILIIHFEFFLPDICRHPFEEKLNFVRCVFIVENNRNSVGNAYSNVSKHPRL